MTPKAAQPKYLSNGGFTRLPITFWLLVRRMTSRISGGRYYKAVRADWECRRCAELRYSSEGGALVFREGMLSRLFRRPVASVSSPRPEVWLPYVFTDIDQALEAVA